MGAQTFAGLDRPLRQLNRALGPFRGIRRCARKPADQLRVADIHRAEVEPYLRNVQEAVDHYFPETLKLQTKFFNGPRFVHFAPLEDYTLPWMKLGLVNHELVGGTAEKRTLERRLVAIYPKAGTLWHNNR